MTPDEPSYGEWHVRSEGVTPVRVDRRGTVPAMDLIKAKLLGFRRFSDSAIDLDESVVAIVGPNEAGKSSILDALASLENSDKFGADLTRGTDPDDNHSVVELTFVLDDEELAYVGGVEGRGHPRYYVEWKTANGRRYHRVHPQYHRNRQVREAIRTELAEALNKRPPSAPADDAAIPDPADAEEASAQPGLTERLEKVVDELDTEHENLHATIIELIANGKDAAQDLLDHGDTKVAKKWLSGIIDALERLHAHESAENPRDKLLGYLSGRRPQILMFSQEQRELASEYPVGRLADPPAVLTNLLRLGGVDVGRLNTAISQGMNEVRYTIQTQANRLLRQRFGEAWRQSDVMPELQIDEAAIRIQVSAAKGEYTSIAERSDGLRTFVAMYAYTYLEAHETPPVLLIDEAEHHLHYDAQADLVRVFTEQQTAAKIIYTTHSAGCLPQDLGRGVRVARPVLDEAGEETGRSEISNSFWTEGPGFSPLMLAMGASVMALVPTRRAIIAEGAADFILLPTLFRQALEREHIEFQVAPGLAEVIPTEVEELALEAPRVAYLLDGDAGGRKHGSKLRAAGIDASRVVSLPEGCSTEDLVTDEAYTWAVNVELHRSYGEGVQRPGTMSSPGRAASMAQWCADQGITPPSKRKVANHLAARGRRSSILDPRHRDSLRTLHDKLTQLLAVPGSSNAV